MNEKTGLGFFFWFLSFRKLSHLFFGLYLGIDVQLELFLALLLFSCGFFAIFLDEISQCVKEKLDNEKNLSAN